MEALRHAIRDRVHGLVGSAELDLTRPDGDPGLFGPRSASWRVHGDFTAMMAGGYAALLLQMLHPLALAGVWDHSDFRRDRRGRLRRTAQFVAVTTYGSTAEAGRLIARVRGIHDHVHGVLPNGTPYTANDPALLTWVHVAEVSSFLRAYLRYGDPGFPAVEQERYLAETAVVAERLGAADVPTTRRAVEAYLRDVRPELRVDERTREVAGALLADGDEDGATASFAALMRHAGIDLLPGWARAMHGFPLSPARSVGARIGTGGLRTVLRWALR